MGQWSGIPGDLLTEIEERLVLYVDKVRIRYVCAWWNSHLPKINLPNQASQFPWLLHAIQDENSSVASHGLFDPIEKKVHHLDLLAHAKGKLFKGSSHGWVVTIEETSGPGMYLINPLTGAQFQLPPRSEFPDVIKYDPDNIDNEYTLHAPNMDFTYTDSVDHINKFFLPKVVLSSSPSREDCVIVAIYGEVGRLAYCKPNDKKWTFLCGEKTSFADIIFHGGKLHALNCRAQLFVFESICPNPKVTLIEPQRPAVLCYSPYLVEYSDGLILVLRDEDFSTFKLYKHDPSSSGWVEVKSIGDDMLFLGWNLSLSISSRDFPGYKGNRIYFADDDMTLIFKIQRGQGVDIGVFNLEDRSIESLPGYQYDPKLVWPPPIWVTPSAL